VRFAIASFLVLTCGDDVTALAQATNPSEIRVTQRNYLQRRPTNSTPSQCRVLSGSNSASGRRPVYCGVVPSVPNWMPVNHAPTLTFQQQMQAAKRGFAAFDLNHNGMISRREWSVSEARAAAFDSERQRAQFTCEADQTFKQIDTNHDGKITFAEWTADNFGKDRQPIRACY
jgi:hypothetical protein